MKKLLYVAGLAFAFIACEKEQVDPGVKNENSSEPNFAYANTSVYTDKDLDPTDPNDPCKEGSANCLYYCCVTVETVDNFRTSIDNDTVSDFLSTGTNLDDLSQGFTYYEELLIDVRDGNKEVAYENFSGSDLVSFVYGESAPTTSSHEAAQVLEGS